MNGFTRVDPARPVAPYFGGKRVLAKRLIRHIEAVPHKTYAEPFVGMGGVFFRRSLRPKAEIVNDINEDIATLFRVVQNHPAALKDSMNWMLSSRSEFNRLLAMEPRLLTDVQRAVRFLFLQRHRFAALPATTGFSVNKAARAKMADRGVMRLIDRAFRRLSHATIECLPWQAFLDRYDRPDVMFYIDPPYDGHEADYGKGVFSPADLDALAGRLRALKGRFVLSLNDTPRVRALFAGFAVEEALTSYSSYAPSARRPEVRELIIRNVNG